MGTTNPGLAVESVVTNMSILDYNSLRYYTNGRASFEALAQSIFMNEGDIAFLLSHDSHSYIENMELMEQ